LIAIEWTFHEKAINNPIKEFDMKFQTRKDKAYTRFGIFTNIFDKEDKMICGGWYFHIHINHRQFAVWG